MATVCVTTVAIFTSLTVSVIAFPKNELKDKEEKTDFSFSLSSLSKRRHRQQVVCFDTPMGWFMCFFVIPAIVDGELGRYGHWRGLILLPKCPAQGKEFIEMKPVLSLSILLNSPRVLALFNQCEKFFCCQQEQGGASPVIVYKVHGLEWG